MSWLGGLALLAIAAILLLPSPVAARAGGLVGEGRLAPQRRAAPGTGPRPRARALPVRLAQPQAFVATVLGGAGVLGWLAGPALGVAAAALAATGGLLGRDLATARRDAARRRELRSAVSVLVGELQAGTSPPAALAAAGAAGPTLSSTFRTAAESARRGHDAGAELASADDPDVRLLGVAWQIGEATGSPVAGVLESVALDLEAGDARRRDVAVALAGPRASAVLLGLLPVLGIALGAAMGAQPIGLLFGTSGGQLLCCAGVLLDVAGVLWIRRILRRAVSQ